MEKLHEILSGTDTMAESTSYPLCAAMLRSFQQQGIAITIERRTWYVDGKYLGMDSPWLEVEVGVIARNLTGDFYGEWQGLRHFDGDAILAADIEREGSYRVATAERLNHYGRLTPYPRRLGNWGEYRIVTDASVFARAGGALA